MAAAAFIIPLAALGFGAWKLAKGSIKAVDELQYAPRGVKVKFKLTGAIVTLDLAIINSQGTPLFFDSIFAKGLWNTSQLGTASYAKRTLIPARGEAVIPLEITVPLGGLLRALFAAWKERKMGVVTLTGTVKAGPLSFSFEEKYPLQNPQPGKS